MLPEFPELPPELSEPPEFPELPLELPALLPEFPDDLFDLSGLVFDLSEVSDAPDGADFFEEEAPLEPDELDEPDVLEAPAPE